MGLCTEAFNFCTFPEYLIAWIEIIYSIIDSLIINYEHRSEGFSIKRGVRQGCQLSSGLFLITVGILAIAIRCNSEVQGIMHNEAEKKINQFANDPVSSMVAEDESFSTALACIDHINTSQD